MGERRQNKQGKTDVVFTALEKQLADVEKQLENVLNAIKQGIITDTTKEALLVLERERDTLKINIAKAQIENPVFSKEQIKFWFSKFGKTNTDETEQKHALIDIFLNSVYVYDDKMLIILNYKDGETCITFDDVQRLACEPHDAINNKENPDNANDCQSSSLEAVGETQSSIYEPVKSVIYKSSSVFPSAPVSFSAASSSASVTVFMPSFQLKVITILSS